MCGEERLNEFVTKIVVCVNVVAYVSLLSVEKNPTVTILVTYREMSWLRSLSECRMTICVRWRLRQICRSLVNLRTDQPV